MDLGPPGLRFGAPVTITLPYVPAELDGADPDTLTIAAYTGGSWQSLGGTVNELTETVSVTTSFGSPEVHPRITRYALMAPASVGGNAGGIDPATLPPDDAAADRTIAGYVLGLAVAVLLLGAAGVWWRRHRQRA
jgi:hypothetical protein